MERWGVFPCRSDRAGFYLLNASRTLVKVHSRADHFSIDALMRDLLDLGLPLGFTEGLDLINFTYISHARLFGRYEDGVIEIDVRKRRRRSTILSTLVHELAHHLDHESDNAISTGLRSERKERGRYVHHYARSSDEEYLARGFELFYSRNTRRRERLRTRCPRLYRTILRLDRSYRKNQ